MRTFTEDPPRPPGTRPGGTRTEREASQRVQQMFSRIAPRYDFLNHLLSFSLDRLWRRRVARLFRRTLRRTDARILDLCCGTGDLTFALERVRVHELRDATAHRTPLFGSDFAQPMLDRAHQKALAHGRSAIFTTADALHLPFADSKFDLITTAFGFRNLVNYEAGLREFARVLRPGGELAILEFSEPGVGLTAGLFKFYFKQILPRVGAAISGSKEAYSYLPGSVSKFPTSAELAAMMKKVGFTDITIARWNFGSVLLHTATRPAAKL